MISFEPLPEFKPKFSVASCVIEHDGKVLLLRRHPMKPQGGTWCLPAGKLDAGERERDAAARETFEETGIVLDPEALAHRFKAFVRYDAYDFTYDVFFVTLPSRPEPQLHEGEHVDFRWLTPEEALTLPLIQDEDVCLKKCYGLD